MAGKRFELHRDTDVTGISGTGVVADGIEFPDGTVVLQWRGPTASVVIYGAPDGTSDVEKVHGHGGSTRLVWTD